MADLSSSEIGRRSRDHCGLVGGYRSRRYRNIMDAEWMQAAACEHYGSDNSIFFFDHPLNASRF